MYNIRKISIAFLIYSLFHFSVSAMDDSFKHPEDTIPLYSGEGIRKSIYPQADRQRPGIYNYLVGRHYRDLYSIPIAVQSTQLYNLYGGLTYLEQLPHLHAIFLEDKKSHLYMVRPLGGATTFLESDFFKNIYSKKEYKGTYIDKFIGDAYTITHPYAFVVANKLAESVGVSYFDSEIYYIPAHTTNDTIADGTGVEDRLISIYNLEAINPDSKIIETDELLAKMQESKLFQVDQDKYIRERLLGLLVGDWNQTKESWQWREISQGDSIRYIPLISDRSHAFTKVDGVLFKVMLGVLGLTSITNYDSNIKNLKKANGIGIPLDVALVGESGSDVWYRQAKYVKSVLTDEEIEKAFEALPKEIYLSPETAYLKQTLKIRRDAIEDIVRRYYDILQQTPVITGTTGSDLFVVDQKDKKTTDVKIYDRKSNRLLFEKEYDKKTKEIWLYGLDGDDAFRLSSKMRKSTPVVLVGGKGVNTYNIENSKNTDIYEYETHNSLNDTLADAKMIKTEVEKVHEYDYKKLRYQTTSFSPWGVYDSDLGFYLGAYFTKTVYGFKRSPYSYQHRIGYSYLDGVMYQGFFPALDENKGFTIEAMFGVANHFHNFFGFGNETDGFKDKPNNYNRVGIAQYSIQPSFYWKFSPDDKITVAPEIQLYNIVNSTDRYINVVYTDNDPVFDTKVFADLNLTYEVNKKPSAIIPSLDFLITPGWTVNMGDIGRNVPYLKSKFAFQLTFTDRISIGTEVHATLLFSNKYEFYQAASVELRGFRDSRFIGRQSLYQHTDLRYDLGHLKNPFAPVQYGVFVGIDYGRVWYPDEDSDRWHTSYGGGFWLTMFKKYTGKFSYFASKDDGRFYIGLGMGF